MYLDDCDSGDTIEGNVLVDCSSKVYDFDGNVLKLLDQFVMPDNLIVSTHRAPPGGGTDPKGWARVAGSRDVPLVPGFADEAGHDFTLRKDARLLKELPSYETIPFHRIGIYQDGCRRTLPPQ
ncbi:MAG: hypothetical protein K9N23_12680 [Akkermansiaceae bacterium]|nr:hypothetical protein [Akkermansiaceae bacterium]